MDSLTLVRRAIQVAPSKILEPHDGDSKPCQDGRHGQLGLPRWMVGTKASVRAGDHRLEIRNRQACQGRAWGDLAIPSTLSMSLERKWATTSFERLQPQLGNLKLAMSVAASHLKTLSMDVESTKNREFDFAMSGPGGAACTQTSGQQANMRRRMVTRHWDRS